MMKILLFLAMLVLFAGCKNIFLLTFSLPTASQYIVQTKKINHVKGNLYCYDTVVLLKPYVNVYSQVDDTVFIYEQEKSLIATNYLQKDTEKRLKRYLVLREIVIDSTKEMIYKQLTTALRSMYEDLRKTKKEEYVFADSALFKELKGLNLGTDYLLIPCLEWSGMSERYRQKQRDKKGVVTGINAGASRGVIRDVVGQQRIIIIHIPTQRIVFYKRRYREIAYGYELSGYHLTTISDDNLVALFHLKNSLKKRKKR